VNHALNADDVEVSVEHERSPVRATNARDDVGATGRRFMQLDAKSPGAENAREVPGDGALAWTAGDEIGISRIDGGELPGEINRVFWTWWHDGLLA